MPCIDYDSPAWLRKFLMNAEKYPVPARSYDKLALIFKAVIILEEYHEQGFQLTLRQLYYQFVARGFIGNSQKNYKVLGSAVNDGRLWGLIDWDHIVDRGREFITQSHWNDPAGIISAAASSYRLDKWDNCPHRVEVWVEKQALEDIVAKACTPWDVGYMACKGYMSQSELWAAAQRLSSYENQQGQSTVVIYLGDHDPSGMDMVRDIQERLQLFGCRAVVQRIALNWDQIEKYQPPPNPAKLTDSRSSAYCAEFGDDSWELDALEPAVLVKLITNKIKKYLDDEWFANKEREERGTELLEECSDRWDQVADFLQGED